MTGNRSQLMNFVSKFLGTVRFMNDYIARIMEYGDYQLGIVTILRVYYVKGLGHNLFSVGQFYNADLEVAFQKNTCFIREASKTKSWLWHHRLSHLNFGNLNKLAKDERRCRKANQTLIEAARTMVIFYKALLFLWAKAIIIACYTQNRLIIHRHYNKTPYELMQDKKPYLSFFHVFGALCYPTNDNDDLGKLDAKADIVSVAAAPRAVDLADSHVSTSIDQDAPSTSLSIPKGTINMGLWYSKDTDMFLTTYADADHMGCQDTRLLGDKLVSWSSKKQKSTAISTSKGSVCLTAETRQQPRECLFGAAETSSHIGDVCLSCRVGQQHKRGVWGCRAEAAVEGCVWLSSRQLRECLVGCRQIRGVFGWAAEVGSNIGGVWMVLPRQQQRRGVCLVLLSAAADIRSVCLVLPRLAAT
nr:hypothetical protein [Tanacetum cinerariifolium]